jgi:hypothetical protein
MPTSNTMSKLKFSLQALANSVTTRADKGVLILVLDDKNVQGLYTYKQLKKVTENWETLNKNYISTAFSDYGVEEIMIASQHTNATNTVNGKDNISNSLPNCLALLNKVFKNGWLVAPQISTDADKKIVADFVKSQRKDSDYPIKAVLYNYEADNEAIVNFTGANLKNTINGTTSIVESGDYTVEVASYLCTLGANESITNHVAKNITDCDIKDDDDASVANGELFLYNNGTNIVFSRGVTSKQTFATNESEALSKIRVVEVIDMVKSDLRDTFNNSYLGKYGNSYANRKSLVSNLNGTYFKTISKQGYLSNDEVSFCELDVDATRNYIESKGTDTDNMKDQDILKAKIDTHVFIKSTLYIMDVIEDVNFVLQYTT